MVLISIVFLFVYLFGAYAYGAAMVSSIRGITKVWHRDSGDVASAGHRRFDWPGMALLTISTVWFVLHTLIEFRSLTGDPPQNDLLDLGTLIVYLFPPVIMHTVYRESRSDDEHEPHPVFRSLLTVMYVVAPVSGAVTIAMIFRLLPRPDNFGSWIAGSIGGLFILASIYSTVLMLRRPRRPRTPDQQRLRNVMVIMFNAMAVVFVALIFLREQGLGMAILNGFTRTTPIYFLIASVYFENRFEFYDLVVKRAVMILLSVFVLGVYFAIVLSSLEMLPGDAARPWLFAVALAPVAMIMPALMARVERWLDRIWLGREFVPVEAVKHVLAAMQPAIDEASLVAATEARLSEIFGTTIVVRLGHEPAGDAVAVIDVPSPVSNLPVRIVVLRVPGMRRFLSEDLAMLRSLAGVFGFMLENIRLQRRRQEQDQLAQELRLQTSKSELKALRAQINPHFLFNALNAIASLIHTDPARADEVVEQLAEVFRYTLRRSDTEWAPLDQELAFARAYLDVEQARFGQRLTFSIDSDHSLPPPQIPSMLLQTLLENAVKHGVSQAREPGRIEVVVRSNSDQITLEVRNTGPTAPGPVAPDGEGFGLHSVRERLKGHFGDRASFKLMRDETAGVTVARISMPKAKVAA